MKKLIKHTFIFTFLFLSLFSIACNTEATNLNEKLRGKILLQVEQNGEAWYINPDDNKRHYMGRPDDAFNLMRSLGIGINNINLQKIKIADINLSGIIDNDGDGLSKMIEDSLGTSDNSIDTDNDGYSDKEEILNGYNPSSSGKLNIESDFSKNQAGKILLQVEQNGEAWYVNPDDNKRYFLGRPADAFNIMRSLGLGISDNDLNAISIYTASSGDDLTFTNPSNSKIWNLINQYKIALNENGVSLEDINNFYFEEFKEELLSEEDCALFYSDKSVEECNQAFIELGSGKQEIDKLNEQSSLINEDERQGIIFQKDGEGLIKIIAIENEAKNWKIVKIISTEPATIDGDSDGDGRTDGDETCSGNIYNHFPEKCIQTDVDKKDSDNDGWWDGIEVQAGTNPNDPQSHL